MSVVYRHTVEVRFRDCDELGHVNNAVYFTYLEETRFAFSRQLRGDGAARRLGASRAAEVPLSGDIILAHAECDFVAQATYGDVLEVRLRVSSVGRSSFGYEYEILDTKDGRQIATGRSVQVSYDYGRGCSMPIPADLRGALEQAAGA